MNEDRVFGRPDLGVYGVCDGHGADTTNINNNPASSATEAQVNRSLNNIPAYKVAQALPTLVSQGVPYTDAFQAVDRQVCSLYTNKSFIGTTVTLARVDASTNTLSIAYVGDSRAMLISSRSTSSSDNTSSSSSSSTTSTTYLTRDHLPTRPDEARRIESAGGHVLKGRVNGVLAVSRAIGDRALKPVVPATPDVTTRRISSSDELLVLASDGLWDVVSKEDVARIIRRHKHRPGTVAVPVDLSAAAEALVDHAVQKGSKDDTSVVLVDLSRSGSMT